MRKKKEPKIKSIDKYFHRKDAIDLSEFPVLFKNYILEWTRINHPEMFSDEKDLSYCQLYSLSLVLYSNRVSVDEGLVSDLATKPMSHIPTQILKDMNLGIQIAEVEVTYIEKKHALVRLGGDL